mgnify:CR=1 FL=1
MANQENTKGENPVDDVKAKMAAALEAKKNKGAGPGTSGGTSGGSKIRGGQRLSLIHI